MCSSPHLTLIISSPLTIFPPSKGNPPHLGQAPLPPLGPRCSFPPYLRAGGPLRSSTGSPWESPSWRPVEMPGVHLLDTEGAGGLGPGCLKRANSMRFPGVPPRHGRGWPSPDTPFPTGSGGFTCVLWDECADTGRTSFPG